MKADELKKKSPADLQKLLHEKRDQVRELRFQLESRQLKDVRAFRNVKKDVAKILTLLKQEPRVKNQEERD